MEVERQYVLSLQFSACSLHQLTPDVSTSHPFLPLLKRWVTCHPSHDDHTVTIFYCYMIQRYADWAQKFGYHLGKKVVKLTGETSVDLRLLRDVSRAIFDRFLSLN